MIAVLWEGSCTFEKKALIAQNAGAVAVLIVSKKNFGHETLTESSSVKIPVRQVPNSFGTWLLQQSGEVKASIKCHEMMKTWDTPSSLQKREKIELKTNPKSVPQDACSPIHMYPTGSDGKVLDSLGAMVIPFPVHSVGFTFKTRAEMKLAGARFEATLSQGITGRFTLYKLDDVMATTDWFSGTGTKEFYTAMFSNTQSLKRNQEYTIAFWIDETRDNKGSVATFPIYFTVDDPYDNDIATDIIISHSFKKEQLPSRPEPFSPVFDICIEA